MKLEKGIRVWIADEREVWIGGVVTLESSNGLKILTDGGSVVHVNDTPLLCNPDILLGANDLTTLSYLHEPAVLQSLQMRYKESKMIYTYCGIVLVAINPYQSLPIYGNWAIRAYACQDSRDLDPHVFAVAQEAYQLLKRGCGDQSIIVSGESGAGKTVNAKYVLQFFATVGGESCNVEIESKVLASNPILEAIGNAKTTRNDNSSRFGKYIKIGFNETLGMEGAQLRTYLLEKTRVVTQSRGERNYHIFYQLLACHNLPEFVDLHLGPPHLFHYTNQGDCLTIDGVDDREDFFLLQKRLQQLEFKDKEQWMLFSLIAAILHLGNIQMADGDNETSCIEDLESLKYTSDLLGISSSSLSHWLCNRQIITAHETLVKPLTLSQALCSRDSLAKHLYEYLFERVVNDINRSLQFVNNVSSFIGILDIYGFEMFHFNSFEQFCINYSNEKLQQQFNMHVFSLEQQEYVSEGIVWSFIDYYDNQPCIDLIEGRLGILDLLDETCRMPASSDSMFVNKLYEQILKAGHNHFSKPRTSRTAFCIKHYANTVIYQTTGFTAKNIDALSVEHLQLLKSSQNEFISGLFPHSNARTITKKKAVGTSVGSKFRKSLSDLMSTLNQTTPHYIRCIKPNDTKTPFSFNRVRIVEQLRACGVIETIRISAAGFPSRSPYLEFFNRYWMFLPQQQLHKGNINNMCQYILQRCIPDSGKYRLGKTKIFFRAGQIAYLEKLRSDLLHRSCVKIQSNVRMWAQRKRYLKISHTVRRLQAHIRGMLARRKAQRIRAVYAAVKIQTQYRMYRQKKWFACVKQTALFLQCYYRGRKAREMAVALTRAKAAVLLQSVWRGKAARQYVFWKRKSIIRVQCCIRQWLAKRKLLALKREARSVCHLQTLNKGLELKVIELQYKLMEEETKNAQLLASRDNLSSMCEELKKVAAYHTKWSTLQEEFENISEELRNEKLLRDAAEKELNQIREQQVKNVEQHQQITAVFNERLDELESRLNESQTDKKNAPSLKDWESLCHEHTLLQQHHQDTLRQMASLQEQLESCVSCRSSSNKLQPSQESFNEEFDESLFSGFESVLECTVSIPSEMREWNSSVGRNQSSVENDPEARHFQQIKSLEEVNSTLSEEISCLKQELKTKGRYSLIRSLQKEVKQLREENLGLRKKLDIVDSTKEDLTLVALSPRNSRQGLTNKTTVLRFSHPKPVLGMLSWQTSDLSRLTNTIITDAVPSFKNRPVPCYEAHILFMCLRYADHCGSENLTSQFLESVISSLQSIIRYHHESLNTLSYWLANTVTFLNSLRQYSGNPAYENPISGQVCLTSFDLSEYHDLVMDEIVLNYQTTVRLLEKQINPLIVPGLLEHEGIPGMSNTHPTGWRKLLVGMSKSKAVSVNDVEKMLTSVLMVLKSCHLEPSMIGQIFKQIFYTINGVMMNNLLLRKDLCQWTSGMQIRYNVNVLEEWIRENDLTQYEVLECLQPIIQATKLLQMKKQTTNDAKAIRELCTDLNITQIQKLLSMYTPTVDYDKRASHAVIQFVAQGQTDSFDLLTNEGYQFPVKLPYSPTQVNLATLNISKHLDFLIKI